MGMVRLATMLRFLVLMTALVVGSAAVAQPAPGTIKLTTGDGVSRGDYGITKSGAWTFPSFNFGTLVTPPANGGTGSASPTGIPQFNGASAPTWIVPGSGVPQLLQQPPNAAGGLVGYSGALGTPTSGNGSNLTALNPANMAITPPGPSGSSVPLQTWHNAQPLNFASDYGAKCDNGITNNDTALTNAIADMATTGRALYIPGCALPYQYNTTHTISAGAFATIYGDNKNQSILNYAGLGANGIVINPGTGGRYFTARDVGFYSVFKTAGGSGVAVLNNYGPRVTNSDFINCGIPAGIATATKAANGTGGINGTAVYSINSWTVGQASIVTLGTGYAVNDTITITGGTGTAAVLKVIAVTSGNITGISVQSGGNYTTYPVGTVSQASTSGAGTGATFTLVSNISNALLDVSWAAGVLTVVDVKDPGGYVNLPTGTLPLAYVSGTASGWTGATVTITTSATQGGAIITSTDGSANNAYFAYNHIAAGNFGQGYGTGIFTPVGTNINIIGNDIESNNIGLDMGGFAGTGGSAGFPNAVTSAVIIGNYIENAMGADIYLSGTSTPTTWVNGAIIEGNWFGLAPTSNFDYVKNFTFKANTVYDTFFYFTANSTGTIESPQLWGYGLMSAAGGTVGYISPPGPIASAPNAVWWKGSTYVATDATTCTTGSTITGSGTTVCTGYANGANWIH